MYLNRPRRGTRYRARNADRHFSWLRRHASNKFDMPDCQNRRLAAADLLKSRRWRDGGDMDDVQA